MQNSTDEFTLFLDSLDSRLKLEVYRHMYGYTKERIQFFSKNSDPEFTAWICPLLKSRLFIEDMPVFREMETLQAIYFLESGEVAYVLPQYQNRVYVKVAESETFGNIDIAFRYLER